jgi:heme/copper-type cytochrome/quinol oxidase subunit 1
MTKRAPLRRIATAAMVLEILLGVGAVGGGIALMAGPHGLGAAVAAWHRRSAAPFLAFAAGCALLIWLIVEIEVVGYSSHPPLQAIYLGLGVAMTLVGAEWIRQVGRSRRKADAAGSPRG